MADTFRIISTVAFILAAVGFLVSLFLGIRFKIWEVINKLSGREKRIFIQKRQREIQIEKNEQLQRTEQRIRARNVTAATVEENEETQGKTAITKIGDELTMVDLSEEVTGISIENETTVLERKTPGFEILEEIIMIHTEKEI